MQGPAIGVLTNLETKQNVQLLSHPFNLKTIVLCGWANMFLIKNYTFVLRFALLFNSVLE
jgi:hypothetical protein